MNFLDNSPLIAAFSGSMEFLVPFLKSGGPVNYVDNHGDSLLHAAADGWQNSMIDFLIISGANPNAQNSDGDTPLHMVTKSRDIPSEGTFIFEDDPFIAREKTFIALLLRGADRKIKNIQGANSLHLAAWEGDLHAINQLARPQDIDDRTSKGATALALSILNGHSSCAKRLIQFSADPKIKLPSGCTILDLILNHDSRDVRELTNDL